MHSKIRYVRSIAESSHPAARRASVCVQSRPFNSYTSLHALVTYTQAVPAKSLDSSQHANSVNWYEKFRTTCLRAPSCLRAGDTFLSVGSGHARNHWPSVILETGWDILSFWLARMVLLSVHITDKVPFLEVLRDDP